MAVALWMQYTFMDEHKALRMETKLYVRLQWDGTGANFSVGNERVPR